MKRYSYYILLTIILLRCIPSFSQQIQQWVTLSKFTQNDGLSSYFITKIIQDSHGFLWVGTQDGLNVFDGNHFQSFTRESPVNRQLGGSFIADIAEDRKRGLIWVLTSHGDITALDIKMRTIARRITHDSDGIPLSEKWLRSLHIHGDTLWFGGLDALSAYVIDQERFVPGIGLNSVSPGEVNVNVIIFDNHHRLWVFSDGLGALVFDRNFKLINTFRTGALSNKTKNQKLRFWDVESRGNFLYAATSWGLFTFDAGNTCKLLPPYEDPVLQSEVSSLTFVSDERMLFSTADGLYLYNFNTKQTLWYQEQNREDDLLSLTFQIYYDQEVKRVWAATQEGLASFSLEESPFRIFSKSKSSPTRLKHLFAILPVSENLVYCGDQRGLFQVNEKTNEITMIDTASSNLLIFKDVRSNLFVSNKNGLYSITSGKTIPAYVEFPELKALHSDQLHCGIQYNDSLVVFSSIIQKGLSVWNILDHSVKTFHNDSVQNRVEGLSIINYLFKGTGNDLFILTNNSIICFNPVTRQYRTHIISNGNVTFNNFMDMCETDSSYWLATYGNGLIEIDKDFNVIKNVSVRHGLSNSCVYRVFAVKDAVIGTTNFGVSVIDRHTNSVRNYYNTDGLHDNAFEQLCGYQAQNRIYCGGINGFTIMSPALFRLNHRPPRLYWNNVKTETAAGTMDTSNIFLNSLQITSDALQTTVSFTALNYANPAHTTFAYKITEISDEWVALGKQNFIILIGLTPGTYSLEVKAANEDGVWTPEPLRLSLIYLPKWYQTWWFKIILMVIVAFIVHGVQRYRTHQIRKQQQIRKEIANDLHDDIGSTLTTVKNFAYLARHYPNGNHLSKIIESLDAAMLGLRDMIWVLDDTEDTIFELMNRIKKFALPLCEANNVFLNCKVLSERMSSTILKSEKRNLFLIAKECINNSIKYSGCSEIDIIISQIHSEMSMHISDNGQGFDTAKIYSGNGLKNIQYRSKQIAWNLTIYSSATTGTMVLLKNKKRRMDIFIPFKIFRRKKI